MAGLTSSAIGNITTTLAANSTINVNQWGGVNTTLGQKAMAASVPMVLASDQSAIPVSQSGTWNIGSITTLPAIPTGTNTIGSVKLTDGTNTQTFMSTTTVGKFGADVNILSILGTAPTTVGKLDVKGADGDVFVRQATGTNLHTVLDSGTLTSVTNPVTVAQPTAANLNATVVGTGTFAVQAAQSGTWNITNVSGTVSLPTGASTEATLAKLPIAQGTALGTNSGPMVQASVTTSAPTYTTGNINPLSLTTAGALRVDNSAVTQPVSGTFWQATQPISAASLPLPSGASTAAKQPALGTAGTASADVITVQGIAGMTKLLVTPDSVALPANQSVNVAQVGGTNSVTAGVNGTLAVGGNVATNVAIGTNPINLGAQGVSAENAAVTATRMVQLVADLYGKLITSPYANRENYVSGATSDITTTAATSVIAGIASNHIYVTHILVTNSHASVGTFVNITEETSGTVLYTGYAAPAGGGYSATLPVPITHATAGKAIQATCVTTGANVRVSASGFKGA